MTDWKGIVKKGWHPEKEGTSLKDQVSGLLGRGDKSSNPESHVSRPITELRDPSSFGPPPKRDPNAQPAYSHHNHEPATAYSAAAPPPPQSYIRPPPPPPPGSYQHQGAIEEPPAPSKPWSLNSTGLSTSHLPPPPSRRDGKTPPPTYAPNMAPPGGPPSLPPRLPPRSGANSPAPSHAPTPPSPTPPSGHLNQGAMSRLGAAGISVPGFGIGRSAPAPPARSSTSTPPPTNTSTSTSMKNGLSELQGRFSRLGSSSSKTTDHPSASTSTSATTSMKNGTTFAQKQAAMRTASNFHKDPSSVSLADARSSASTANNFRQRHGEQVASGLQTANSLNQRYGISERAGFGGGGKTDASDVADGEAAKPNTFGVMAAGLAAKKKPAPPPPRKKAELSSAGVGAGTQDQGGSSGPPPPPVPLATRPKF
ncbi:uncharacterized protein BCR38DRAFT_351967 [Pseudomassariella vexata]|uniref:Uncharacterized protein n=1 Tax=Pseudomassariella vexata TaxID=1141098 RepID=A0A1Y2DIU1_9PEZI|nr:uncharacterized protein BCR38DRAFT_351967 [Pseudomassariella vexata]ORY59149.1 hypothetical protein BCR38DRAFT_351967 [Pseudomassariella vexata]